MHRKERAVLLRRQQRALTAVTAATAVTWLIQALQMRRTERATELALEAAAARVQKWLRKMQQNSRGPLMYFATCTTVPLLASLVDDAVRSRAVTACWQYNTAV
eukprot:1471-Heterococcus_DN1.PRE.2